MVPTPAVPARKKAQRERKVNRLCIVPSVGCGAAPSPDTLETLPSLGWAVLLAVIASTGSAMSNMMWCFALSAA